MITRRTLGSGARRAVRMLGLMAALAGTGVAAAQEAVPASGATAAPAGSPAAGAEAVQAAPAPTLEVMLIGTGIPLPNPERAGSATLVIAGDRRFLVDTGHGSFGRLAQAGVTDVTAVLFTHYHSDHISDFGEIMVGRTIGGARAPLPVIAPVGVERVVNGFLEAYALDTEYRVDHHGDHFSREGMKAEIRVVTPGVVYEDDGLKITMFDVDHDPIKPAVGYRFDWNGSSVVISGDTKRSENLIAAAKGCDILIHEAMNEAPLLAVRRGLERSNPRNAAMLGDAMEHHTPTLEVARIAAEAGAKKLVLTHLLPSIAPTDANDAVFSRGMSEIYGGPIVVGRDLMRIKP